MQASEANRFAIEPLAPRSVFRPFLKGIPGLARIVAVASRLDLSREASARRHIELREEPLALVFSKDGMVRYVERRDAFPFLDLRKGSAMPSVPLPEPGDPITDHDEADPRNWGMPPNGPNLIVQTLHQRDSFAIACWRWIKQTAKRIISDRRQALDERYREDPKCTHNAWKLQASVFAQ